jgi:hypothetical protein
MKTPVLLLTFNRLEPTKKVFESIRKIQPRSLYIASDGSRPNHPGETEKIDAVRSFLVESIDWPCQAKTLFREKNLGCRLAVSTAIDWFFSQETEGIILEDDCLPDPSFFFYAEELLERYRNDKRIMVISGNHFHGDEYRPQKSYLFSRYNHCWGWATWARAWQYYDHDMRLWPALRDSNWLLTVGDGSRKFQRYWTRIFDMAYSEQVNSWAYRWTFSCWSQSGLSILPAYNLVKNIGFNTDGTHTQNNSDWLSSLPVRELNMPMSHPSEMIRDYVADSWTDTRVFKIRGSAKSLYINLMAVFFRASRKLSMLTLKLFRILFYGSPT